MNSNRKIRVLIVDDSHVTRRLFAHLIANSPQMEVVGEASDGEQALAMVSRLQPDVVSMDIEMPHLNGIEATRHIMAHTPVPVVIVSSLYNPGETRLAMEVLAAGAVAVIPKPSGPGSADYEKLAATYLRTLKVMSEVRVVRRKATSPLVQPAQNQELPKSVNSTMHYSLVVIGASAGGPEGVKRIVSDLPADFPLPVAIVQHIDINFAEGYAQWLAAASKNKIVMVTGDVPMRAGSVYISIRPQHLVVKSREIIGLSDHHPDNGLKPSVDALFRSAREVFGSQLVAVLLSGMGKDGAHEMLRLKQLGAFNIIQDEQSCLVFGMPGEAARLNAHHVAIPPSEIVPQILKTIKHNKS
ncbi:MAG: chemotaxis-specific protein-glutamate methyltransferase CheB [Bacteroidetes bacterium]|nr:chemotaxis-specific protein-glutamate methyltransferase CheB [Bacteroidota bacterium]